MDMEHTKDLLLRHICESCGKEDLFTSEEGFRRGWNYPPRMGAFGALFPRTCGACATGSTLWHEMIVYKTPVVQLSSRQQQTLYRILTEPKSILLHSDKL